MTQHVSKHVSEHVSKQMSEHVSEFVSLPLLLSAYVAMLASDGRVILGIANLKEFGCRFTPDSRYSMDRQNRWIDT